MRANRFIRHVTLAAQHAVVHAQLAHRAKRFVVKGWHAQRCAQLFIEFPQVLQVRRERGDLESLVGQ